MAEKYQIIIDMGIFAEQVRPVIKRYFDGEISGLEASILLGWDRSTWETHITGMISVAATSATAFANIQPMEAQD